MKISTSRFGKIEICKDEIISFEEGLLGFGDYHKFVILNTEDGSPFRWLQCVDDGNLAFVIIEPLNFMFEYDVEISDSDQTFVGLERAEDVVLYVIVSIPANPSDMTANLQGPVVINAANHKGRQIISSNSRHSVKVRILDEMEKRAAKLKEVNDSLNPDNKEGES
ncbi:MAG TPA: flagellar assembly protein FliW [Candidatus Rifleibacterium sp.]|nr:flagellar assembly protein FliW [Candidatus Rifleibacterium sp.]HPT45434.1 flagellar assembly protein FliW [Candidatus Rifleibacterium sp.]